MTYQEHSLCRARPDNGSEIKAMTSKSFRTELPALGQEAFDSLRRWGLENCAESFLYRQGGNVMWLATRERARTREDFARAVRSTLKKLSIDTSKLRKGHWLTLTCDEVVKAEASVAANLPHEDDAQDKVITLFSSSRRTGAPPALTCTQER